VIGALSAPAADLDGELEPAIECLLQWCWKPLQLPGLDDPRRRIESADAWLRYEGYRVGLTVPQSELRRPGQQKPLTTAPPRRPAARQVSPTRRGRPTQFNMSSHPEDAQIGCSVDDLPDGGKRVVGTPVIGDVAVALVTRTEAQGHSIRSR
jgi:hypothetical protein